MRYIIIPMSKAALRSGRLRDLDRDGRLFVVKVMSGGGSARWSARSRKCRRAAISDAAASAVLLTLVLIAMIACPARRRYSPEITQ